MAKSQYNPWEDKKTFVQYIGNTDSLLDTLSLEDLNSCPSMPNFSKQVNNNYYKEQSILPINIINDYANSNDIIDALNNLYEQNTIQYNKLEKLEVIYEKYKYKNILSPDKNLELLQKINDLNNFLLEIKQNKNKLLNLLHNSGMTDSHVIKIKHSKKLEFIKLLKICCNKNNAVLDMVELYENMHDNTLIKLKQKIDEEDMKVNALIKDFKEIQNIQSKKDKK